MADKEGMFGLNVATGEPAAGAVRIVAEGELDSGSSPELLAAARRAMADDRTTELTLDLSQLSFIDSSGMRALIELEHAAAEGKVSLVVVPAPEPVTELLHVAGVAGHLSLVENGQTLAAELDFLERSDLELPADELAPARARATVRELLGRVVEGSELEGVTLMTSELVTNAVIHSSAKRDATVGLRMVVFPEVTRIEVDDPGLGFEPGEKILAGPGVPGPGEGGRGLFVIDRLAARWGVRRHQTDRGHRFSVWFEVETS